MIIRGQFSLDSGRLLYDGINKDIQDSPFLPHGLYADQLIIAQIRGFSPSCLTYPHNYFYEIFYQFGVPLEIAFIVYNVYLLIRWSKSIEKIDSNFFIITMVLIPMTFIQLMVSSSYLISFTWDIAMALLVRNRYSN